MHEFTGVEIHSAMAMSARPLKCVSNGGHKDIWFVERVSTSKHPKLYIGYGELFISATVLDMSVFTQLPGEINSSPWPIRLSKYRHIQHGSGDK